MLQLRETRIVTVYPHDVLTGVTIPEEGQALVYAKENGDTKVTLSSSQPGEVFAGVSYSRNSPPGILPIVLEGVVKADNTFKLPRTPIAGQLLVKSGGAALTVVAGAPANGTEIQVTDDVLTFNALAGSTFSAQFMYYPTTIEARSIIGDAPIGGLPSTTLSSIGVLKVATISTNMFDAGQDWTNTLFVKTAATGIFTVGTANDHIQGVIVKNSPSAANPFLVLTLNVA
jgi:hypothetical protein